MGHIRLGRLPYTIRWNRVVELLESSPENAAAIAHASALAAEGRLRELKDDPSLAFCFWLLTRLTWAARGDDFTAEAARLGVETELSGESLTFISRVSDVARNELRQYRESGVYAELAMLALRRALSETIAEQAPSFFSSSVQDLQNAVRQRSTRANFGNLARRFFGDFLARTLRSFIDRELANHVGPSHRLADAEQAAEFSRALDTHARESARIVERFAGDWYSKHNWETAGSISREEAQGFVAQALRKLRAELRHEAASP
jgi:hypothetical protein